MRAAVFDGTGLTIEDVAEPQPRDDEIVVAVRAAGVCGTDLHAGLLGVRPGTVIGHEFWGEVVEAGPDAGAWATGQAVCALPVKGCGSCLACVNGDPARCRRVEVFGADRPGTFAERVAVGAREAFAIPPGLSSDVAALIEPLAVGFHTVRRARLDPTDRVLVLGAGPIGLAVVLWCRHAGVRSIVVGDPVEARRDIAARAGASSTFDPTKEPAAVVHRASTGNRPDVVFECVGGRGVLDDCIDAARAGARIVVAGLHTGRPELDARRAFFKELELVFAAFYDATEFGYTIDVLASQQLDPSLLVSHRVGLDELPAAYDALKHPTDHCKVLVELT